MGMTAYMAAGRYFSRDVIFIAPRLNESHLQWSMNEVEFLQRFFWNYSFSAESRGNVLIETPTHQATTTVIYTDPAYFRIHFMEFIEGNRWAEDTHAIVINEALAWQLFGGGDVAGLTVTINHRPHIVAGVVRQDARGQGDFLAWMPRGTAPAPLPVTALYLHAHNYNIVDTAADTQGVGGMLAIWQRNPKDYAIVDVNRYVEAMGIRSRIFIYLLWLYVLVLLVPLCIRMQKKMKWQMVFKLILPVCGILIASYVLFTGFNHILHWLPNIAAPHVSVFNSITNLGALPPDGYLSFGLLRLSRLNRMGLLAWVVGAVAFVNVAVSASVLWSSKFDLPQGH